MSLLVNSAKVRRFTLDRAASTRRLCDGTPRFTRVSKQFFIDLDAQVRSWVESKVHSLPSAGRTV